MTANSSLIALVDTLSRNGHHLRPIDDGVPDRSPVARFAERLADPSRPLRLSRLVGHFLPRLIARRRRQSRKEVAGVDPRALLPLGIVVAFLALPFAWRYTGLSDHAVLHTLQSVLGDAVASPIAPLVTVACFVLAGLVAFPVILLILGTAAIFGPWLGMAYSAAGVGASACIFYAAGTWLGSEHLKRLGGKRWTRLRTWLQRRELLAVVALRVLPMAPFTLVNLAIGASGIRFVNFAVGTLIGMGPGLAAMSFLGSRLEQLVANPSLSQAAWLSVAAALWIGVAFGAQKLVSRFSRHVATGAQ